MSQIARELARRLAAVGIGAAALAPTVREMAVVRAEAINGEGLRSQIEYLLEAYGPGEIEAMAAGGACAALDPERAR